MLKNRKLNFLLLTLIGCTFGGTAYGELLIEEASGIARLGNTLLIVGDNTMGNYYEYDISDLDGQHLILSDADRLRSKRIVKSPIYVDFEGVDVLADGKVIVLSERLHSLVSEEGTIISYSKKFGEFGNAGLEGLASRPTKGVQGSSDIAVLWEGGYPMKKHLPPGLDPNSANMALQPVVILHTVVDGKVPQPKEVTKVSLNTDTLSKWIDKLKPKGQEPYAYRFRAPDLVWHRDGFIVLLSAVRYPSDDDSNRYGPKVLQRFSRTGEPIGQPYDIAPALRKLKVPVNKNWEGLAWYAQGKTLMLVNDDGRADPIVPLINIPNNW